MSATLQLTATIKLQNICKSMKMYETMFLCAASCDDYTCPVMAIHVLPCSADGRQYSYVKQIDNVDMFSFNFNSWEWNLTD